MPNENSPKELGYETRDVGWPLVLWTLGIVAGFAILSIAGLALLFTARDSLPAMRNVQPVATADERPVPPGPLLQARPPVDMQKYKAESMAHLNSYGWIDKENGVVRVPIERGLELALEKGFPTGTPEPAVEAPAEAPLEDAPADESAEQN